ncbi:MAG: hypothetical protein HeimC2_09870 [Candidatus Heimdallarchaeota archaeon LC_2]|nr:MAG: hypothetical protein HeimC2_09870 [Candidatus Heimdallarchaeota archaeon LC_2]
MRNKLFTPKIIIIEIIIISNLFFSANLIISSADISVDYEEIVYEGGALNSSLPLHFWRADENLFPISDSNIFPMASLGKGGSFANLGVAWITWTIKIQDKFIAAWAIYDKGQVVQFTLLEKFYNNIYWNSVQDSLILIGSTDTETDFYLYFANDDPLKYTMDAPSNSHQVFITVDKIEVYLNWNNTDPFIMKIMDEGILLLPVFQSVDEVQISSLPGLGGLFILANNSIELRIDNYNKVLPSSFTNKSRLGHYLLTPTVFDLSINKMWVLGDLSTLIDLPSDTTDFYEIGLSSSIIQTQNNSFYEYTPFGWNLITRIDPDIIIQDFSIVDLDLYFGTVVDDGLQIYVAGGDSDGDFIPDVMEDYFYTLPQNIDSDSDTIPDALEISFGTDPNVDDRLLDIDNDGISNILEYNMKLDPGNADSDFGGAIDGWEIKYEFNPLDPFDDGLDNDNDGLENSIESLWGTNPFNPDSDGDKLPDSWEVQYNLDPLDSQNAQYDFDNDGRSNYQEFLLKSDPLIADPPSIFEGLLIWMIILFLIITPGSYYVWQNYLKDEDEKSTVSVLERINEMTNNE